MFKRSVIIFLAILTCSCSTLHPSRSFPSGSHEIFIAKSNDIDTAPLKHIASIAQNSIARGQYPGAVILASHRGRIIYRGVFGSRRILPNVAPMQFNTIFDIASLTKVVVTTTAIMQLVEKGQLHLNDRVSKYWPAFGAHGKQNITVRELLTHSSGLPTGLSDRQLQRIHGKKAVLQQIATTKLRHWPGDVVVYSDLNFITLGYLVELRSGQSLDNYATQHIFKPLAMNDTFYRPSLKLRNRIAPTEYSDTLRWGVVQDPIAYAMGGVAGSAGLFSDASDLGKFAQSMLDQKPLLQATTIEEMTIPQTPKNSTEVRGLGWDINSHYTARGTVFPMGSFGHTGWTGTSMWIDPTTQTWLIVLTSRAHPTPLAHNQVSSDRRAIADEVASSVQ